MGAADIQSAPPGSFADRGASPGPVDASGESSSTLAALADWETADSGISAPSLPEAPTVPAPTPTELPGGRLVTSADLKAMLDAPGASKPLLVDVAGEQQRLPGAVLAEFAGRAGDFNDKTQTDLGAFLGARTGGRRDAPVVFYCGGPSCWGAYNAALRAVNLGYTNVSWYRGGLEAWQRGGLTTKPPNWGVGPQGQPWSEAPPRP